MLFDEDFVNDLPEEFQQAIDEFTMALSSEEAMEAFCKLSKIDNSSVQVLVAAHVESELVDILLETKEEFEKTLGEAVLADSSLAKLFGEEVGNFIETLTDEVLFGKTGEVAVVMEQDLEMFQFFAYLAHYVSQYKQDDLNPVIASYIDALKQIPDEEYDTLKAHTKAIRGIQVPEQAKPASIIKKNPFHNDGPK